MMDIHKLIAIRVALAVRDRAGCARREEQVAREWREYNAECRKFRAEAASPAYVLTGLGP